MGVDLVDERNETATLEGDVQFQASYGTEDDCKQTLDPGVEKGQITTPGFPNQYPYNEVCKWKWETATSDIIRVYFDSFQVFDEHNFAIEVTSENVTTSVLSKSGDEIPDDLILTQLSDMTFSFDSSFNGQLDDLNVGQGVKAYYEVLSCGGNITKENGTLKSPGFPANISASTRCVWVVTLPPPADNSSVSILKFKLFAGLQNGLSNEEDPSINSLMIRDGGSLRAPPITGNLTDGKEFLSRTNIIWVEYVFEPGTTKNKGFPFQLNYTTYACPVSQQCKNGICMHPDWKCDGYDQCGDHSDEDDCTCVVTKSGAVSYLALAMSILATAVIAVLIACFAPMIYRRVRFGGYSELRDFMTPVPT